VISSLLEEKRKEVKHNNREGGGGVAGGRGRKTKVERKKMGMGACITHYWGMWKEASTNSPWKN